jgi:hypothetical protein
VTVYYANGRRQEKRHEGAASFCYGCSTSFVVFRRSLASAIDNSANVNNCTNDIHDEPERRELDR